MLAVHMAAAPTASTSSSATTRSMRIVTPTSSLSSHASAAPVSPALVTPTTSSLGNAGETIPARLVVSCPIYGDFTITEAPLIDLLLSPPVQRLKDVLQHGITGLIGLTPSPPVTRHEHSVGAMLLVRQAGGTIEAQASALLHDVAHTALSHVVDGAYGYVVHEEDKHEYLDTTVVPSILRKHFDDPAAVLEEHNYPLLELDAPAICADRLDYGIRDSYSFGFLTLEEARSIAKDLRVSRNGTFCFASQRWARRLSEAYMRSDEFAWSNPRHSLLYKYAADTIKRAARVGLMRKEDLWIGGDKMFWATMTGCPDLEVQRLALKVTKAVDVDGPLAEEASNGADVYSDNAKIRTIDPDVLLDEGTSLYVRSLSELDADYRDLRTNYIARKSGQKHYRIFLRN